MIQCTCKSLVILLENFDCVNLYLISDDKCIPYCIYVETSPYVNFCYFRGNCDIAIVSLYTRVYICCILLHEILHVSVRTVMFMCWCFYQDEDCEEGEIKEPGARKPFVKPICRFYTRGQCTWGNNCRFLHPGINDKGETHDTTPITCFTGKGMLSLKSHLK